MKLLPLAMILCRTAAFSIPDPSRTRSHRPTHDPKSSRGIMAMGDGNNMENPLKGMELTSALARMDRQWQIQQRKAPSGQSRWTQLVLPKEDEPERDAEAPFLSSPPDDDLVYLLEPSGSYSSIPSCLIVFVGGAGLGQFPQIAYSEFLMRLSDRLNAAILAAPYSVGLDHFELAKRTGDRLRRGILFCQDDPKRQYPPGLPTFALSHSLGCKLQTIYVAATAQNYRGMGFISFNNFGFGQTIQMARTFAEQLRGDVGNDGFGASVKQKSDEAMDVIFGLAETLLGAVGLEFSPSAQDTERLIALKFDQDLQRKTRLFVMDQDDLDSSVKFAQSCIGPGPSTSGIPGTHLTPVFFKLGLENLELPEEARDIAREFSGGYQSASFGDEGNLNELLDEVSNWILGKEPARNAHWDVKTQRETPALKGSTNDE